MKFTMNWSFLYLEGYQYRGVLQALPWLQNLLKCVYEIHAQNNYLWYLNKALLLMGFDPRSLGCPTKLKPLSYANLW
jgi:hypothetical protein